MFAPQPKNFKISSALIGKLLGIKEKSRVKRIFLKISFENWKNKATTFFMTPNNNLTAEQVINFYFENVSGNTENARDYFLYRFGQPR